MYYLSFILYASKVTHETGPALEPTAVYAKLQKDKGSLWVFVIYSLPRHRARDLISETMGFHQNNCTIAT